MRMHVEETSQLTCVRRTAGAVALPDICPRIAVVYQRKVTRLAPQLDNPSEHDKAVSAIHRLIESTDPRPSSAGLASTCPTPRVR